MENYTIGELLGKGAQGLVYLAEHNNGQKFALKKIECNDESEANKAYREAVALRALKHPYVSPYREFFVSWDEELSAMYVTNASEYYPKGDLAKYLKQKQDSQEAIKEGDMKKWLGQLVDAMMYVHKRKFIHRDLKPSNIFLTEDDSIAVGDFGVPTVIQDMRTKTRTPVGLMNYSAPEVLEKAYDEKSDVWSMGCIALEMASCSFCDSGTMSGKLFEIKHNDEALENLLLGASKIYTEGLITLIRNMLKRDYNARPNTHELSEMAYVRECLVLSNSVLADRKKRQQTPATNREMPRNQGSSGVIDYLMDNLGNEASVKEALTFLTEITKNESEALDRMGKRVVLKAMKDYISEGEIQVLGFTILENLVVFANTDDILYSSEIIGSVPEIMKTHFETHAMTEQAAASFLAAVSATPKSSQLIGDLGCLGDILSAMRYHVDNVALLTACCNSLWCLTVNEDNVRIVTELKGVNDVIKALKMHKNNPELVEAACAALLSLSMEDENVTAMAQQEVVATILEAMELHIRDAKVIKNACMALSAMVEPDEECAYKLLTNIMDDGKEIMGIPVILKSYEQHKDNAEVVENICILIMELAEYEEIRAEIKHLKVGETMLHEVHKRFKENKDIMKPCEAALLQVGGGKIYLRPPSVKSKQRK